MRKVTNLITGWKYLARDVVDFEKNNFDDSSWQSVYLPHTNKEIPLRYFDDNICSFISNYRKKIIINKQSGKRYRLLFEGVSSACELYINGILAGEHKCAYTDFLTDITDLLNDGENVIAIRVDSRERPDVPPFGGVVDYLCYGGIYREVFLVETPEIYIADVYCSSPNLLEKRDLSVKISVGYGDANVSVFIKDGDSVIAQSDITTSGGKAEVYFENLSVDLWSVKTPKLYDVVVVTGQDKYSVRYGFRVAEFTTKGFYLNGERLQLMGLNRHQSFPYVGYAMPKNAQYEDADILKFELGVNLVRSSHYPPSRHFLDRCDEIGLLVFEEIPGWNHIGDQAWKDQSIKNLIGMIERDRNHSSVILWGVRINESDDDHEFYTQTNNIAHSIDYRQTAGVRWKPNSELLEDVFAINDFVPLYEEPPLRDPRVETGLDYDVPYLVTEYMGHMFPTKITDNESRLVRHAERHAQVQNTARGDERISGAIGWCAFDYHTHRHFGTNDKICYHGVMDMFRNPKYAANVYSSQRDVNDGVIFEPATIWAFGEKDIGGVLPLFIYTNVESVLLCVQGREPIEYFPAHDKFPNLPHPPIIIEKMPEVWGSTWKDVTFIGLIDKRVVVRRVYSSNPLPAKLDMAVKTAKKGLYDSIRFKISALDDCGNVMKFFDEPIKINVTGGKLIGPEITILNGGMYSFWVIAEEKEIQVKVSSERLGEVTEIIKI